MMSRITRKLVVILMILPSVTFAGNPWKEIPGSQLRLQGTQQIRANHFRSFFVDREMLLDQFAAAPAEDVTSSRLSPTVINLPLPDGSVQAFRIFKTNVMHPDLAARYPAISTYGGQGITDPSATAKFDFTQFGFHAMILSSGGTTYIDPFSLQDPDYYMVYSKKDFITDKTFNCLTEGSENSELREISLPSNAMKSVGAELKTYRLAMGATGEYTSYYGGTVAGALAGIVTSVNRVTGVYEREFSIRLVLVANTDTVIFTNPSTDPYTNNDGGAMLGQNQTTMTARIGSANYDMGHVFSTGGGGIANLGCICNFSHKAKGVTGLPSPIGDPFDIDYVAHEMGHQFGGNHTFNCETGGCAGNRAFTAAYEPGSGSTIMAYAGLCGSNNLQSNSDDYFHTKSFDEIITYTTSGIGNICPVVTSTFNNPPVINPVPSYIIPYLTPFRMTGDASDPDGDPITYCWEQYNLGPAGSWSTPVTSAPIFRSFDPTPSPVRLFPKLLNILNNNQSVGEVKPSYARTLLFKLTVRDNKANGGGVTNNDTPFEVEVINTGQAFAVTSPNVTGITWQAGGIATVTWDVGGSDVAPINTPLVNILLSTDAGQTFTTTLATGVANNGSYNVNVPNITTATARVMVEGAGNIFFDINDKNFAIGTVGLDDTYHVSGIYVGPNPAKDEFELILKDELLLTKGNNFIHVYDVTGKLIMKEPVTAVRQKVSITGLSAGLYSYVFINGDGLSASGKLLVQ